MLVFIRVKIFERSLWGLLKVNNIYEWSQSNKHWVSLVFWAQGSSDVTVDGAYIAVKEQQKHLDKYSI